MNLGKSIKIALAKAEKDQSWLAQELNLPQQEISRFINQSQTKRLKAIGQMADVFDMKVSEFIALGE